MDGSEFQPLNLPGLGGVAAGDPAAPPVLLVHGWGGCCLVWRSAIRRLSKTRRIVSLDLPGTGETAAPASWSIDELAAWVLRSADRVGFGRFALVGHSMGANISTHAALLAPDRVTHLGLVAAAIFSDRIGASRHFLSPATGPALMDISRFGASLLGVAAQIAPDREAGDFWRPWFRRCGYVWSRNDSANMLAQLRTISTGPADLSRLPEGIPVFVAHGKRDSVIPAEHVGRMVEALRARGERAPCRSVVYPRGRHVPMDDLPDRFSQDLLEFLDTRVH